MAKTTGLQITLSATEEAHVSEALRSAQASAQDTLGRKNDALTRVEKKIAEAKAAAAPKGDDEDDAAKS
jgi:hypothetical protein